jgi:hypothetical protein
MWFTKIFFTFRDNVVLLVNFNQPLRAFSEFYTWQFILGWIGIMTLESGSAIIMAHASNTIMNLSINMSNLHGPKMFN